MLERALVVAALLLGACGGSKEEAQAEPWPPELGAVFTERLADPAGDQILLGAGTGSPTYLTNFPSVDVKRLDMGVQGDFLYLRILYAAPIPSAPQRYSADPPTEAQTVHQHSTNLVVDVDSQNGTGFSGEGVAGIDLLFGVVFRYGESVRAYAIYDFPPTDDPRGQQDGEVNGGGPGHDYVIVRHRLSSLGSFNPSGRQVEIGSWSEAESDLYHHFAFDTVTPGAWSVP